MKEMVSISVTVWKVLGPLQRRLQRPDLDHRVDPIRVHGIVLSWHLEKLGRCGSSTEIFGNHVRVAIYRIVDNAINQANYSS